MMDQPVGIVSVVTRHCGPYVFTGYRQTTLDTQVPSVARVT